MDYVFLELAFSNKWVIYWPVVLRAMFRTLRQDRSKQARSTA